MPLTQPEGLQIRKKVGCSPTYVNSVSSWVRTVQKLGSAVEPVASQLRPLGIRHVRELGQLGPLEARGVIQVPDIAAAPQSLLLMDWNAETSAATGWGSERLRRAGENLIEAQIGVPA